MKILFLIPLALFFVIIPVYGQLSDATGLVNRLDIQTGGHAFEVETVANFNIYDFDFNGGEKKLTLYITSGLENNLGELIIPTNLLGGNFTFYLNEQEFSPKINYNEKISFVTLNFTGSGDNTIEIIGTTYLDGLTEKDEIEMPPPDLSPSVDYDYALIYALVIALIVGVSIPVIVFLAKRKK